MRRERRRQYLRQGMQTMPHLHKERALVPKGHVVPFTIMDLAQIPKSTLDFPWTILTFHDMTIDDIERLGGIGHGLDAAGEEPTRAMDAKAMTACESSESNLESATATETIGFGEDARLHLAQEVEGKRGSAALVRG